MKECSKTALFFATMLESEQVFAKFGYERISEKPFEVWRGKRGQIAFVSGVGLVNAGACFAYATANFDFDFAVNLGAAGDVSKKTELGEIFAIDSCVCLEPYNTVKFGPDTLKFGEQVADFGMSGLRVLQLASASRPVISAASRTAASRVCDLVDMEGYAFVRAASVLGKKIALIKFASDFSATCDIPKNIKRYRDTLNSFEELFS